MDIPLRQYWELLSRHIRPQKARFALLAALLLGGIGLQVANPQIMRAFIDAALGGGAVELLLFAALAFLGIALLQQAVSVGVAYLGENVAWTATNALRAELARHCLDLDMSFHNDHTPGELIERIDGDVAELANFFSQFIVVLIGNLLLLAGILIALFWEDWRIGLAFSLFAVLALLVLNRVRDIAVAPQKARRQAEADLFGFVEEQLAGAEDLRSSGAVGFCLQQLFRLQAVILRYNRRAQFLNLVIGITMGGILTLGNLMAVAFGYFLFTGGAITIGTVYLFIHYINLLEQPISAMTHEVESFQVIGACVERLTELRKIRSAVQDSVGREIPSGPLGLAFERVSFAYQDGRPRSGANATLPSLAVSSSTETVHPTPSVLENLSFHLAPGTVLGLLGRTGSGKTTIARLVFRLYDPAEGRIILEGADIREAKLEALRKQVAIVTQDVQLFRATVRDNLTFFDRAIPDEQIQAAIEALGLADWYRSLPDGLDTLLDAGGHSLSAGEAQLLAFTRVFLRNPGLVILDEASARLDPVTEQRIERAIDTLLKDRTAIVIAHRLDTIERADEIMILEQGRVSERGRRQQLAEDPESQFHRLLQTGLAELLA